MYFSPFLSAHAVVVVKKCWFHHTPRGGGEGPLYATGILLYYKSSKIVVVVSHSWL